MFNVLLPLLQKGFYLVRAPTPHIVLHKTYLPIKMLEVDDPCLG